MNPTEPENMWGDIEREWRSTLPAQDQIEARVTELSSTLPSLDDVTARCEAAREAYQAAMREVRAAGDLEALVQVLPIIRATLAEPGGRAALTSLLWGEWPAIEDAEEAVRRGWLKRVRTCCVLTPRGNEIHRGYRQIVGALRSADQKDRTVE